ncbi:ABC transport system substrate-binding protein [Thermosulfidibacter takaii ABI70S6]|uniref:ABC transport system substrate-binding protein n=1 Tax=Thermosulfidibacter takaii (strain DSM 17441 / JCM 13301 / NBRC 103674 / ABI70S6) TaxID=1298851 RepID=A0A0S3QSV8_THET7|nr:MlaD family protein [Thermosulfidibacter takaii]BAT71388.1 ABC transport system substrate-binding protein [Thermosulfidibacter takaii ABI70S6]
MEPKPNYVILGLFLFLFIAMGVAAVLWLYGYRGSKEYRTYVILTEESVSGVRVGSPVKYKGVDVGKVTDLRIDPEDPNVVMIFLRIEKGVPIHQDTVAQIVPMGITGLAYIGLSGGREGKPFMVKIGDKEFPVIRLELSEFQKVSRSLPELMAHIDELIGRMNRLFNDKNIEHFSVVMANLRDLSEDMKKTNKKVNALLNQLQKVAMDMDRLSDRGVRLIKDLRDVSQKSNALVKKLNEFFEKNEKSYTRFSQITLRRLDELVVESEKTVRQLKVLLRNLEEDPSILIYGVEYQKGPGEDSLR